MGLARAARPARGLGCRGAGASAGRVAGALGAVAGGAGRVRGPAAPDRGPRPVVRRLGGLTRRVAVRPDGHGVHPDSGRVTAAFAAWRGALRGRGRDLPAAAREPQGGGGEGQPHRRAALVAHPGRRRHRRRARRPAWTGSASGSATPAPGAGTGRDHGRRAGRRRGAAAGADRAVSRPSWPSSATVSAQALVAFRGNSYSVRPGDGRRPRSWSAPARRRPPSTSSPPRRGGAPAPPRTRRGRRGGPPRRARRRARGTRCWPRSPTGPRAGPRPAARPRRRPARRGRPAARAGDGASSAERVVIDFAAYAAAVRQPPHRDAPQHGPGRELRCTCPGAPSLRGRAATSGLRAHLAYLKLADAAAALPGVLDQARAHSWG